ncbi:hypothetical protein BH20ACT13_BH20ACT13_18560 [soil metagenome]
MEAALELGDVAGWRIVGRVVFGPDAGEHAREVAHRSDEVMPF